MNAIGILAFVVALLVSVVLHEGGHFLTAKRYGMKVTQFFAGFGPTVFSRWRGETEYGVKAIPAGGFVKIVGMTSLEEIDPADEPRAFYKQPAGRRAVVLSAGSITHFILAIILIWLALLVGGQPDTKRVIVSTVSKCVDAAANGSCDGKKDSPATRIGLLPGDEILSVDGRKVTSDESFRDALVNHGPAPVTLVYERDEAVRTVTTALDPLVVNGQQIWRIGVSPGNPQQDLGPISAIGHTPALLGQMVTGTASSLYHFPSKLTTIFSPDRDPAGAVGVIGISRFSGDLLSLPDESLAVRVGSFLLIVAGVNFFVGVFNLLPLMPLDGGHLAVLGYEQGRHRLRRARGYRGEVKRVDLNKLLPATYAVVAVFAVLTLVLATADIVNPIKLG